MPAPAKLTAEEAERVKQGLCGCGCGVGLLGEVEATNWYGDTYTKQTGGSSNWATPACRQRAYRRRRKRGEVITHQQRERLRRKAEAADLLKRAAEYRRVSEWNGRRALEDEEAADRIMRDLMQDRLPLRANAQPAPVEAPSGTGADHLSELAADLERGAELGGGIE